MKGDRYSGEITNQSNINFFQCKNLDLSVTKWVVYIL